MKFKLYDYVKVSASNSPNTNKIGIIIDIEKRERNQIFYVVNFLNKEYKLYNDNELEIASNFKSGDRVITNKKTFWIDKNEIGTVTEDFKTNPWIKFDNGDKIKINYKNIELYRSPKRYRVIKKQKNTDYKKEIKKNIFEIEQIIKEEEEKDEPYFKGNEYRYALFILRMILKDME